MQIKVDHEDQLCLNFILILSNPKFFNLQII